MLTRGVIIGNIIDDLSDLRGRIDFRCQLGLTDLNKFCEDFVKDVLNICYGYKLKNLNAQRSNEPGIDLGDKKNKIAFQVTSTGDSTKVNSTLEKITKEQLKDYEQIKLFILGNKQGTYKAIKQELKEKCSFNEKNDIWDIADLCKHLISLEYDVLYELYKLFEKEFQIVIIEIEIPNKEGIYPTTLSDKLEVIPNTKCTNAVKFLQEYESTLEDVNLSFEKLARLPRLTREFLEVLIKRGENNGGNFDIDYYELKQILKIPETEIRQYISILTKRYFLHEPDEGDSSISTRFNDHLIGIIDYAIKNDCLREVVVSLDFRLLDEVGLSNE